VILGEARERLSEDGLRPLRALCFIAQLGFSVEWKTVMVGDRKYDIIWARDNEIDSINNLHE
jgi:phosphoglycolate phosphatase-like HAD superfamily hydrolase